MWFLHRSQTNFYQILSVYLRLKRMQCLSEKPDPSWMFPVTKASGAAVSSWCGCGMRTKLEQCWRKRRWHFHIFTMFIFGDVCWGCCRERFKERLQLLRPTELIWLVIQMIDGVFIDMLPTVIFTGEEYWKISLFHWATKQKTATTRGIFLLWTEADIKGLENKSVSQLVPKVLGFLYFNYSWLNHFGCFSNLHLQQCYTRRIQNLEESILIESNWFEWQAEYEISMMR